MQDILNAFQLKGKPLFCQRFGEGHINETYITTCDTGLSYILQKINTNTFKDPVGLMENVSSVTDLSGQELRRSAGRHADCPRQGR